MTHHCPECGRGASPVYCAASTDAAPLMLAHTVAQAARMLGISGKTMWTHLELWRDGWRIVPMKPRPRKRPVLPCAVAGCDRPVRHSGLCTAHYSRMRRGADMSKRIRERGAK
jgi:hypothetical protein